MSTFGMVAIALGILVNWRGTWKKEEMIRPHQTHFCLPLYCRYDIVITTYATLAQEYDADEEEKEKERLKELEKERRG